MERTGYAPEAAKRFGRKGIRQGPVGGNAEVDRCREERYLRCARACSLRPAAASEGGTGATGQGDHQRAFQQQTTGVFGLCPDPLRKRRRRGAGSGKTHAALEAEVPRLHLRCRGRSRPTGGNWEGI